MGTDADLKKLCALVPVDALRIQFSDFSAIKQIRFEMADLEQIENDFKDPEDGFWGKNNSEGIVSNSEVPVNLDIRGECRFARVQL